MNTDSLCVPRHQPLRAVQVMGVNGVSHHVVEDDLEGCAAVLQWLSYISPVLGGPAAALPTTDPIDRSIGYLPGPGEGGHSSASGQIAFAATHLAQA